jgi:hypothetical protein
VSQPVPYSVTIVTVVSASVARGQSDDMPLEQTYAQLDFTVQNTSQTEDLDYSERQTWDLVLADGTRIPPANPLGLRVAAANTGKASLRYPLAEGASLAGAAVILDVDEPGFAEPERVPLDGPWSSPYPTVIPSLVGAKSTGTSSVSDVEIDVTNATVSLNDPDTYRAGLGKKFVRLDLVTKNLSPDPGGAYLGGESFRIVIDGLWSAPQNSITELLPPQTSMKVPVVFEIDKDAKSFDIHFEWYGLDHTYHVEL